MPHRRGNDVVCEASARITTARRFVMGAVANRAIRPGGWRSRFRRSRFRRGEPLEHPVEVRRDGARARSAGSARQPRCEWRSDCTATHPDGAAAAARPRPVLVRPGRAAPGSTRRPGCGRTRSARPAGREPHSRTRRNASRSPRSRPRRSCPRGAVSNRRRSSDTRPNGPGDRDRRVVERGHERRDQVGLGLHARCRAATTTGAAARRIPALSAAAQPSRVRGPHDLGHDPRGAGSRRRAPRARLLGLATERWPPRRAVCPSGACVDERAHRAGEVVGPVRGHDHDASPIPTGASRAATARTRSTRTGRRRPSSTSGPRRARGRTWSPLSMTFQPAASIRAGARRRSPSRGPAAPSARGLGEGDDLRRGLLIGASPEDTGPGRPCGDSRWRCPPASAAAAAASDRERKDPGVGKAAPQHGPGSPVQPAVEQPAAQRAERLVLGLAEVDEGERQRGDDHGDGPRDAQQREQQEPAEEELGRDDLQRRGQHHLRGRAPPGARSRPRSPAPGPGQDHRGHDARTPPAAIAMPARQSPSRSP